MALPVTALFAAILVLWIVFLTFKVVGFRRGKRVSLGAGDDVLGERLIRAHGNATETIPIFLIMLGLAEGLQSPAWLLYALGVLFCLGRLLHGIHFLKVREGFRLRFWGMLSTLIATIVMALNLLRHVVGL